MGDKTKERIEYVDVYRSIGIILMVMGHIGFGDAFDIFIHAFHMPMFFVISGFLFKNKEAIDLPFKQFALKKAKALLVPYIVFAIGHYLIWIALNGFSLQMLVNIFSVNTKTFPIAGALWFLTALFFTDIIYFAISVYIKSDITKHIVVACVALFGCISGNVLPFTLPFALEASMVGTGLFHIGNLVKKNKNREFVSKALNMPLYMLIVCGVVTVALIFINGYINMRVGTYSFIPLFFINVILSFVICINISKKFCQYAGNIVLRKWLVSIGRDSIVYVCLNQLVIMVVRKCLFFINSTTTLTILLKQSLILAISLLLLWICSEILTKTKLKVLLGKF